MEEVIKADIIKKSYPKLHSFTPKRTGEKVYPIINKNHFAKSTIEEDARYIGDIDGNNYDIEGYFLIAWQKDLTCLRAFKCEDGKTPLSISGMGTYIKEMFEDLVT